MSKIPAYKLTKEFLDRYAQEQIDKYLSVGPVDEKLAEQHISNAYEVAKLARPKNFIWYDSPKAWDSVWASVGDSVGASVRASVGASVRASVRTSVGDSVWASAGDSVGDSVWDSVRASVGASVWDSVRASVGASVRASVRAYYDADYNAWLKYFNDHQEENDFRHMCMFDEMITGYHLTADTVHIVRKPIFLARDSNGRLDSDARKAIEWADGYGFYYLHGVEFDEATWNRVVKQEINLENLSEITNADQRAVAVQMLKPEMLLKQVKAKLINTGKKGTKLYEVKNFMDTGDTEYCMLMEHPSIKGKHFIEWVEPKLGALADADMCQAKAFGITKKQYLEAMEA